MTSPEEGGAVTFELSALYRAVDGKRYRMFKSWSVVASESGVSLRTIRAMNGGTTMEADGVLAMARWVGEPPETWARPKRDAPMLEYMPPDQVWRVDAGRLRDELDAQRVARGLSWQALAIELGGETSGTSLSKMASGKRISIGVFVAAAAWLDEPTVRFTTLESR